MLGGRVEVIYSDAFASGRKHQHGLIVAAQISADLLRQEVKRLQVTMSRSRQEIFADLQIESERSRECSQDEKSKQENESRCGQV